MKFTEIFNNFTSGLWTSKVQRRSDSERYKNACSKLTNFIPQVHGGVQFRGGFTLSDVTNSTAQTYFDAVVQSNTNNKIKLVPYIHSDPARSCMFAFTNYDGAVKSLPSGEDVHTHTYAYAPTPNGWDVERLVYTQVGNILVVTTGQIEPMALMWNESVSNYTLIPPWAIPYYTGTTGSSLYKQFLQMFPWGSVNALDNNNQITITGTVTAGGSVTLTGTSTKFLASMVGEVWRFCDGVGLSGLVKITGYTSTTVLTGTVVAGLPSASGTVYGNSANADSFWQEPLWSNRLGWPRTVTAFQGRLIYGGTKTYTDSIFGSRVSDYFNLCEIPDTNTTGVYGFASSAFTADNTRPFRLTPNSPEASNIVALSSAKTLTVHTDRSEIVCYGSNGALGPNNAVFDTSTSFGAKAIQPVRINNFMTFVQRTGLRIRDIIFSFQEDQYKSTDLSFTSDGMLLNRDGYYEDITALVSAQGRNSLLYALTRGGALKVCCLDRDYQVNAWAEVDVGYDTLNNTRPIVKSICYFNNRLYAMIARYNPSLSKFECSLECMREPWEYKNPASIIGIGVSLDGTHGSAFFLDQLRLCNYVSGQPYKWDTTYTPWIVGGIANKNWFANRVVSVLANGAYLGEFTVDSSGILTLPVITTNVFVGYKYTGEIEGMPMSVGSQYGTGQGRIKKIDEIVISVMNTLGIKVGTNQGPLYEIPQTPPVNMGDPPVYESGDKVVIPYANYDRDVAVVIKQEKPYPAYIRSVAVRGQTYEG